MAHLKRIWLIDDDEDDGFILQTALAELDQEINFVYVRDSEVALSKITNEDIPDLLFLDWNMPKFSGLEVLTAIRKIPHLDSLPIIIYTTADTKAYKEQAMRHGASYFLPKQPTLSVLCKKLEHILALDWTI
jgi:CheY-like chemotaxis protein